MSITTSCVLPAPIQQSFSFKLLSVAVPYMIHKIPAELKNFPRNGGTTFRQRRYNPLATAPVPLGPGGITPPPQQLTALNIDATIDFYGTFILMNEQVTLQNQDPALNEAAQRLGVCLRQTEDQLMSSMLVASSAFVNCVGGGNGDNPTEITRSDVDEIVKTLRGNNAYSFVTGVEGENRFGTAPVRDAYFGLGHTDLIGQLDAVTGFEQKWSYPNQQSTLDAEWGVIANIRYLLSSIGSITPNASLLGANVYNIFNCGRESFCAIEQDGYSCQFIYRPPIYDGPLALNCSVGFKFGEVPKILNDSWIINQRCTLA